MLDLFGPLALAAALTLGGAGAAAAATEINTNPIWNAAGTSGAVTFTGGSGAPYSVVTTSTDNTSSLTSLLITGRATLNMNNSLTFSNYSSLALRGDSATDVAKLNLAAGKTLDGDITINNYGTVEAQGIINASSLFIRGVGAKLMTTGDATVINASTLGLDNGTVSIEGDTTIQSIFYMAADASLGEQTNLQVISGKTLTISNMFDTPGFYGAKRAMETQIYPESNIITIDGSVVSGSATPSALEFSSVTVTVNALGSLVATDVLVDGGSLTVSPLTTVDGTGGQANIYKSLTVQDATAIFSGLMVNNNATVTLGSDHAKGSLNVASGGSATFRSGSTLVVNAEQMSATDVAVKGASSSQLSVESGAQLKITGGKAGTYAITSGFSGGSVGATAWLGSNLITNTSLLAARGVWNGLDYTLTLGANSDDTTYGPITPLPTGMIIQQGVDENSSLAGVRFVSRAVSNDYIGASNPTLAAATLEGAAQMAVVGAVPGVALSASRAGAGATALRTGFVQPAGGGVALQKDAGGATSLAAGQDFGLSAGDRMKNGLGLWTMPLYQADNVYGMKSSNFKTGYNSSLGGVAVGADYTFADAFRLGAAVSLDGGQLRPFRRPGLHLYKK